jgi:predicted metal-dependent enzyme (double-stranded beta helix superfamily)
MTTSAQRATSEQRAEAIERMMGVIRDVEHRQGVTRDSLAAIRSELIDLGLRAELFPEEEFGLHGRSGYMYTLSVDPDQRFALYLDCSLGEGETPPHNHTTWAVIAGVRGEERNRFYRRIAGDGAAHGALEPTGDFTVRPGEGVCLLPDDFHSVCCPVGRLNMNLHLYGRSLSQLTGRVQYDAATRRYRPYGAPPETL